MPNFGDSILPARDDTVFRKVTAEDLGTQRLAGPLLRYDDELGISQTFVRSKGGRESYNLAPRGEGRRGKSYEGRRFFAVIYVASAVVDPAGGTSQIYHGQSVQKRKVCLYIRSTRAIVF